MTTADHILDQIDGALADYDIGPDAMRIRPADDSPERPFAFGGYVPNMQIMDEAGEWQEVQGVIRASFDMELDQSTIDTSAISTDIAPTWEDVHQAIARVEEAQVQRAQEILAGLKRAIARLAAPAAEAAEAFRHLPEAVGCDDCGPPPPPRDRPAWQSPYGPPRRR